MNKLYPIGLYFVFDFLPSRRLGPPADVLLLQELSFFSLSQRRPVISGNLSATLLTAKRGHKAWCNVSS